MSDTELIDFVETHGVQTWPMRAKAKRGPQGEPIVRRIPGDILSWTAQFAPTPFIQVAAPTWRLAVSGIMDAYKKRKL